MNDPQRVLTRFVGVAPDEVRAAGTGLYEVTTTAGVPVRLHDMSLTRLTHDAAARKLVMVFRYDDQQWTPPEAEVTPVAVFSFDDVEVVERQDESAAPETPPDALRQFTASTTTSGAESSRSLPAARNGCSGRALSRSRSRAQATGECYPHPRRPVRLGAVP